MGSNHEKKFDREGFAMTREEVLNKAMSAVCGDRDHDYGGPESSFECIARM